MPSIEDLTSEGLTDHVINISSNVDNPRNKYLVTTLIRALHNYIREVDLKTDEWETAWEFLTKVGQACHIDRQEFILLSDVLGVSALVDTINSAQQPGTTESSVLGPFHNPADVFENGATISRKESGEAMLIRGTVKNKKGEPIDHVLLDIWETNGRGHYDMTDPEGGGPDCRGKVYTNSKGEFYINGVRSVDYPVPYDGPVGVFLNLTHRNAFRPAHVHFLIEHPDYARLNTALYDKSSVRLAVDPVFGTKASLCKDYAWCEDLDLAKKSGTVTFTREVDGQKKEGFWLLEYDFVLAEKQPFSERKTA